MKAPATQSRPENIAKKSSRTTVDIPDSHYASIYETVQGMGKIFTYIFYRNNCNLCDFYEIGRILSCFEGFIE